MASSPVQAQRDVLNNIQALRALAALLVVFFHLKEMMSALGVPLHHMGFAALGVDLFFVISGFIMVYTTDASHTGGARFFKNRIARVVPLYWVMTLFVFAIAVVMPSLLKSTQADPINLIKSLFFIPYARADGQMLPILFLGWSLNYEMFFYVIFALALWCGYRRYHVEIAILAILAFVLAGMALKFEPDTLLNFYTNPKMLEFVAGMLIARAMPALPALRWAAILGFLLGFAWLVATPILFEGTASTLSAIGACSVIVIAALAGERGGVIARWPFVILLGDASYSLYLVHPLITEATIAVWRGAGGGSIALALVLIPAALVASVLAAIVLYRFVEVPLSRYARNLLGTRRSLTPARGL